jgi:ATP-dependent Clp protease ATP-binding subunit ClpA
VENPLSQKILSGAFKSGDTIEIDVKDGRFSFAAG